MPTNEELADILERAVGFMNDEGAHWTQGHYMDFGGPEQSQRFCSVGAIRKAVVGSTHTYDIKTPAQSVLIREATDALAYGMSMSEDRGVFTGWDKITTWNDQPRRRWDEVRKRFEKQIARLRGA